MRDAMNRDKWGGYEEGWLAHFGLGLVGSCVREVEGNQFFWEPRCLQGCIKGSQSVYWTQKSASELRHHEGWVIQIMDENASLNDFISWTLGQCGRQTVHLRIFATFSFPFHELEAQLRQRHMISEVSFHFQSPSGGSEGLFMDDAWVSAHVDLG